MTETPEIVFLLWWITLVATVVLIVPVTLRLLYRAWTAARTIRRYAADTREAAEGIADNVAAIATLDDAVAAAGPVLERVTALRGGTG